MLFICHIKLNGEKTQDDEVIAAEEYVCLLEAADAETAEITCYDLVPVWASHRVESASVAPMGQLLQIR